MNINSVPFVSIIVPVHNAGINIRKCMDTLVNQSLKEIEIICVLDKPTDGTDLVVEEYGEKDKRIKIILNEANLNISESRNRGLKIATGEYIGFSDHDDWRETDMYEKLYKKAKKENADIVTSNSSLIINEKSRTINYNVCTREGIISSIVLPLWSGLNPNTLSKSVWASIYRKEFLFLNNIYFPDKRIYHEEDTLFNLKAFIKSSNVSHVNEVFYHWIIHENSASNQPVPDLIKRSIRLYSSIKIILFKNKVLKDFSKELGILISTNVFINIYQFSKLDKADFEQLSQLEPFLCKRLIDKTLVESLSKKKLILFTILKIKLTLFHSLYLFFNKKSQNEWEYARSK